MRKLINKAKKPLKNVLKPLAPVIVVGITVAMMIVLLVLAMDWGYLAPAVGVPFAESTIQPIRVLFLSGFLVGVLFGSLALLYRRYREALADRWDGYSTWLKSMIAGVASSLLTAVGLGVAVALDWIPISLVFFGVLVTWPIVVGMILLGYRRGPRSTSAGTSIRTAYVLTRGLEPRTLSAIVGLLVAIATGLIVSGIANWWVGGVSLWIPVVLAGVTWAAITLVAYNRYDAALVERTELTIERLQPSSSRAVTELTVANTAGRTVDLSSALIRDTDLDLYRPEFAMTLKPGQQGTFEITGDFSLEPNDDSTELPLGYDLKLGADTPAIFTTDGAVHYLQWTENTAQVIGRDSADHLVTDDRGTTRDASSRTGRTPPAAGEGVPQD
ncbi:hypothetical protein [Natranaeroarchaeum aerophilus]|uniref:Uncharacterized protein n=1 Tax=Natranaeroarchaeum aerophilus TaxID=2917711 RepID=A0AAE3K2M1_9EURY|nr:hypothetical protein [Natranaeroarchaeum aerophilus]MCL9812067.1 hypothetical protein [Natranaeroarchaeum aerophilus]